MARPVPAAEAAPAAPAAGQPAADDEAAVPSLSEAPGFRNLPLAVRSSRLTDYTNVVFKALQTRICGRGSDRKCCKRPHRSGNKNY